MRRRTSLPLEGLGTFSPPEATPTQSPPLPHSVSTALGLLCVPRCQHDPASLLLSQRQLLVTTEGLDLLSSTLASLDLCPVYLPGPSACGPHSLPPAGLFLQSLWDVADMERLSPEGTTPSTVPQATNDPVTGSDTELGSRCPEACSLMVLKPRSKIHPKCTKIFFLSGP